MSVFWRFCEWLWRFTAISGVTGFIAVSTLIGVQLFDDAARGGSVALFVMFCFTVLMSIAVAALMITGKNK